MEYIHYKENMCNSVSIDEVNQVHNLSHNNGYLDFGEEENFVDQVKDFTNLCLTDPDILNYNFTHKVCGNENSFYNVMSEHRSHAVPDSIFTYHKSEKITYSEIHNDNYSYHGQYKHETDLSLYSNSQITLSSSSSEYVCNSISPSFEYECNSISPSSDYVCNSISPSSELLCNSIPSSSEYLWNSLSPNFENLSNPLSPSSNYPCNSHSPIAQQCSSSNTPIGSTNTWSLTQPSEESHRKCLEPLTSLPLTVGPRSSMWEWPPQSDPVMEKRRQRAIKAHNKRERARRKNQPE